MRAQTSQASERGVRSIADYTYNYEAALKQLNIKPDILVSRSMSSDMESSMEMQQHKENMMGTANLELE